MFSDNDDNQGLVLGVVFGVIALVIALVIGLGVYQLRLAQRVAPVTLLVPAASSPFSGGLAAIVPGGAAAAGVAVEVTAVKIFFEPGQTTLPPGAAQALSSLAQEVLAGKSLSVSSWLDLTGDAARNGEIARQRALSVRELLASLGVPPDRIVLQRPVAAVSTNRANPGVPPHQVEVRAN